MGRWVLDTQFVEALHAALKRLRRQEALGQHPLAGLAVVAERRRQGGWPETVLGRAAALQEVLSEARKRLAETDPEGATLLEQRFWRGESVIRLAHERHVAESTLYVHQEQAIHNLARVLWAMEQAARKEVEKRRRWLARNIPAPTYTRLFGFDRIFADLRDLLTDPDGPRLISIEGLGGLGKTALVHRLAMWAAEQADVADIAWVTAQRHRFVTWHGIIALPDAEPALTFEGLLDDLVAQLDDADLVREPPDRKEAHLRTLLRERPHLVVVDNLETAVDHQALVPRLWELAGPTRFLLTSRYSLSQHSGVFCLTLDELGESDSIALMRHEASYRGVHSLVEADEAALRRIYETTGGNPLAIKLVVGQARSLPLDRVLARLKGATGRQYEGLFRFIYWRSWEVLSDDARRVLLAMPALAPSGTYWENLQAATGLPDDRLDGAIDQLVAMSLLQVVGREEKRYAIHQLTYTFIMTDLLEEWEDAGDDQRASAAVR